MSKISLSQKFVRPYIRVTLSQKQTLIHYIFRMALSVKSASRLLKINYPTAKCIISKARKLKLNRKQQNIVSKPCGIKKIMNNQTHYRIISYCQGTLIQNSQY